MRFTDETEDKIFRLIGEGHMNNIVSELKNDIEDEQSGKLSIKILKEWDEKKIRNRRKKMRYKVAGIVIIVFSMTITMLTSIDALKWPIFNIIRNDKEISTEFIFEESIENQPAPDIEEVYYLSYVPVGYTYERREFNEENGILVYSDGNQNIIFEQNELGGNYQIDTEDSSVMEINIGENSGYLVTKQDRVMVFWTNEEKCFLLVGRLSSNEMMKIANHVKLNSVK